MRDVIHKYGLQGELPDSVARLIGDPLLAETPKGDHPAFRQASWHCLLSNFDALHAGEEFCRRQGWFCSIETTMDEKPADDAVEFLLRRLVDLKTQHPDRPVCVVAGGEVRVRVTGNGIGGRNQAFALQCVEAIAEKNITVLSAGTDGIDGNSRAAGAVADGTTRQRAREMGMDPREYLQNADSNTFFAALGDDIVTGDTGTNVRDLRVLLHV